MKKITIMIGLGVILLLGTTLSGYAGQAGQPDKWIECQVVEVMECGGRIHAKCLKAIDYRPHKIKYVAIGVNNKERANRFLNTVNTAIVSGLTFRVLTSGDPKKNPVKCKFSDCRYPLLFGLKR